MVNLLLVINDAATLQSIKYIINSTEGYNCIGSIGKTDEIIPALKINRPDIVVIYCNSNFEEVIKANHNVKSYDPLISILVVANQKSTEKMFRLLRSGANGYLEGDIKPIELISAIKELYEGGAPISSGAAKNLIGYFQNGNNVIRGHDYNLSPREKEVLKLLIDGIHIKDIAKHLYISIETVRFHFKNIYRKLKVKNQAELVAKTLRENLI